LARFDVVGAATAASLNSSTGAKCSEELAAKMFGLFVMADRIWAHPVERSQRQSKIGLASAPWDSASR
jgi:hypothetical protein